MNLLRKECFAVSDLKHLFELPEIYKKERQLTRINNLIILSFETNQSRLQHEQCIMFSFVTLDRSNQTFFCSSVRYGDIIKSDICIHPLKSRPTKDW